MLFLPLSAFLHHWLSWCWPMWALDKCQWWLEWTSAVSDLEALTCTFRSEDLSCWSESGRGFNLFHLNDHSLKVNLESPFQLKHFIFRNMFPPQTYPFVLLINMVNTEDKHSECMREKSQRRKQQKDLDLLARSGIANMAPSWVISILQ